MKYAVILAALSSTTVAAPFSDYLDAIFGNKESRHAPPPELTPGYPPIGTGSACAFPFPTATGAPPTSIGGIQHELGTGSPLPSFSLADPTDGSPALPTETEGDVPLPTGQPDAPFPVPTGGAELPYPTGGAELPLPTGDFPKPPSDGSSPSEIPLPTDFPFPMPTGGSSLPFPGTGIPGLPTTLQTLTHGPQPTSMPELPDSENSEEGTGDDGPGGFFDWISSLFGGNKSETSS